MSLRKQQGVALITAVLIVALVTATAVAMASRQQLDIRRSSNVFNSDQAYWIAVGSEDIAIYYLNEDRKDNSVDNLGEDWAAPLTLPIEHGAVSGRLEDMQGRFNINNLISDSGDVSDIDKQRFGRLLALLKIDASVAQAVVDWLDADIDPSPNGGAEDDYYMLQSPPYRAANRLMVSASELRLVKGMDVLDSDDVKAYDKLAPYVTALPTRTAININTALPPVLAMLASDLSLEDGEDLAEARGEEGFENIELFLDQALLKESDIINDGLDVKTDYFLLSSVAEFDDARSQLYSVLLRGEQGVKVILRSRGVY